MNFFKDQDRARSQTRKLVLMYVITIILTAILTGVAVVGYLFKDLIIASEIHAIDIFYIKAFYIVFGFVAVMILVTSFIKIIQLGKGGSYVAMLVDATLVDLNSHDPLIKRYINIVEEMSIASGTPVPGIYIMQDEDGINALAAGYEIDDAIIAVSRGALRTLNREELQGVVAHEFSHIFNGDMKLNIRLIGYLFGLSMISGLGHKMIRIMSHSRRGRRQGAGVAVLSIGLILIVIGSLGMFFAGVIKSAISRQREFLADASAVQFTRNPDGIGGALKKIYASQGAVGSCINAHCVDEVSHFFFSSAVKRVFSLFSTHPPLEKRLKAIFGKFDIKSFNRHEKKELRKKVIASFETVASDSSGIEKKKDKEARNFILNAATLGLTEKVVTNNIETAPGTITNENIDYAQALLESLDEKIKTASRSMDDSYLLIFSLFLDKDLILHENQLHIIKENYNIQEANKCDDFNKIIKKYDDRYRLPIVELTLHTLKRLSYEQKKLFLKTCKKLVSANNKISTKELILYLLLLEALDTNNSFFEKSILPSELKYEIRVFFSFLAIVGNKDLIEASESFNYGYGQLYKSPVELIALKDINYTSLKDSLSKLKHAKMSFKKEILISATGVIKHDGRITSDEFESLRLLSEFLLVPMPPVL